jgi:glutathione S-transferase
MKLVIGNKAYSSWSFRPWILMRVLGLPFEQVLVPLYREGSAAQIRSLSPGGKVPALVDGDIVVWESLSIIEYLADRCPMNMRRAPKAVVLGAEAEADVARILAAWDEALRRFGGAGPFLYGAFSGADAMYAPVVSRFHAYGVPVPAQARAYMDAIMALPAWREWTEAADAEPWHLADSDDVT